MKEGTGGDPFADESDDDPVQDDDEERVTIEDQGVPATEPDDAAEDAVPWAVRRNSVKAEREMVQFYLQASTLDAESGFQHDVEQATGYDVYTTDLREAAYLVAMNHVDEVAELLDEWGCEYA